MNDNLPHYQKQKSIKESLNQTSRYLQIGSEGITPMNKFAGKAKDDVSNA